MKNLILNNAAIVAKDRAEDSSRIIIAEGKVAFGSPSAIAEPVAEIDVGGSLVTPGFIDIHNHGAVGVDVNDASADDLLKVAAFLAKNGVTSWVPTLVPDSFDNYQRIIGEIDRLMEMQAEKPVAQAVGVHYEGVFANRKMCGALRPEYFRSGSQLENGGWQLPRLKEGIHITTLAPEIDGGINLILELVEHGWIVSIGHTNADVTVLDRAYAAGARHITHFFNAMTGVHHRDIGVAGWGLTKDGVTFDIIADGIHVDPKMLELACRARSAEKVALISDSVAPTGLGDGEFELWGEIISVSNGRTRNERGSIAGSVCTMLDCVRMMRSLGFSDHEVALMASANPARLLGINDFTGSIEAGKDADLVVLDQNGNVKMTVLKGVVVET